MRVTVEQDIIFPNIPDEKVDALSAEPIFEKFRINPTPLTRRLVSCTGAEVNQLSTMSDQTCNP